MTPDVCARLSEALSEEADALWKRLHEAMLAAPQEAPALLEAVGLTVGRMQGWAAAVGWYAKQVNPENEEKSE